MLNRTQAMAGIIGNRSAKPRLSDDASAMSAICCTAKAGLQAPRVENIAPASAVPAMEVDSLVFSVVVVSFERRFLRERSEVGFVMSFVGLWNFGELGVLKHFVFIMVIEIMVDAIVDECVKVFVLRV
ncbi:unnamed protein product [Lathyrus sativus]|nr:unnamed protein product [Lathyrus sativus]